MEKPDISSALGTKMVLVRAAHQEKVYVHKALLGNAAMGVGECKWSCFPRITVKSFVEYLYQGDYTHPSVMGISLDASYSADEERHGGLTPCSLDYELAFLTHAQLFILSRYRNVPSLASLCLKRLEEAMEEAQGASEESIFVKNMSSLIEYSYNPCCHDSSSCGWEGWEESQRADDGVWEELQKAVCGFLVSRKGWLLEVPGSLLIDEEEQLTKDLLTTFINLSIDTDKLLMEAERKCESLKTEIAQSAGVAKNKPAKKKKSLP